MTGGKPVPAEAEDAAYMARAVSLARAAGDADGAVPIACVIVRGGRIIAEAVNEVAKRQDPTAHAEIVAIRAAAAQEGTDLRGATLYSTLQPCGMCAMGSIWAHVSRIVYGAERHQVHDMYFEDRHFDTMDFIRDAFRQDLAFTGGVLATECAALYHRPGEAVAEEEQGNR